MAVPSPTGTKNTDVGGDGPTLSTGVRPRDLAKRYRRFYLWECVRWVSGVRGFYHATGVQLSRMFVVDFVYLLEHVVGRFFTRHFFVDVYQGQVLTHKVLIVCVICQAGSKRVVVMDAALLDAHCLREGEEARECCNKVNRWFLN